MTYHIKNYYQNIMTYDLLTKFHFSNLFQIPKINQIYLNIGFKKAVFEKKKLINIFILLKLITNQKPISTKSKKNNILLKIKKNTIIGCKMTLRKKNIFIFLEKLILFILPNMKIQFHLQNQNILNFQIQNIFNFLELKREFLKFKNISFIDVSIHTNCRNHQELFHLLNFFYFIKEKY